MSDTDTDDTDLLLLIPPNFYVDTAERLFLQAKMSAAADALAMPPPPAPTTNAYQFLPPHKKTELNHINSRLQNLELVDNQLEALSDISTISNNTVRTIDGSNKRTREMQKLVHSTPKSGSVEPPSNVPCRSDAGGAIVDNILLEIDNYLDDQNPYNLPSWQHHSDNYLRERTPSAFSGVGRQEPLATSLPSELNSQREAEPMRSAYVSSGERNLISLSELWGRSNLAGTVLPNSTVSAQQSNTLKEEQLRRQHLEKTVQALQSQLLEYEQRISVAIEVDRSKDTALASAEQANKSLNLEVQQLRDALHRLEMERNEYNGKMDGLQHELAQAVGLATKFQEKIERLESELQKQVRQASESSRQVEELEIQLHGTKRAEEMAHAELTKVRDKFAKVDYQQGKLKAHIEELEKENTTLRHQKEMLQEYHQKQKTRADALETQRKSLQETLANLTEIETNLKKKLETQQKTLKLHYQQQLENVVAHKLKDFQEQLDKSADQLKTEARERERLIADRAVKQLEMINEKNNLELNLVQEKHNKEVELYRLQLANASKSIEELELKLSSYKTKRADIAEKLHGVMEAQWQQALAILTSPNHTGQVMTSDTESESPELNTARHYADTPKTSKSQRSNSTEKNNLDVVGKRDPASPMDKLQAYIELLLSKSPSDFDRLDEILALGAKSFSKTEKDRLSKRQSKPPWKS
ncbi:cilia- and flagella-associated protein 58 [Scaptodrosophila lebanonensis]|uniref:Cilia- and flagella-associated protein 58 n=1 Tax=Drosophila lebanonensis TaxID=7225 RepID=A0A6J2TE39_DROLE|nr:cilia- and flagella-associated protein 58 [Scaptodrosophila lebanonensis]